MTKRYKRTRHLLKDIPEAVRQKKANIPEYYDNPPLLFTLIDVVSCRLIYGASIEDYFDFRFYWLNHRGRKTYGTVRDKFAIYNFVNQPEYCKRITDKALFAKYYADFTKRVSYDLDEKATDNGLMEYCDRLRAEGTKRFIIKPCDGGEGIGVFILDSDDDKLKSVNSIFEKYHEVNKSAIKEMPHMEKVLNNRKTLIIEPVLENHPNIAKIHPSSLNTMRIPTLYSEEQGYEVLGAYIRFGRDGNFVDNINRGGMTAEIDLDTGIIMTPAVDHKGRQFVVHPTTGEVIVGATMPFWEEVKEIVLKAASITPEVKYVGWDVAITAEGPVIIEGNTCGSLQLQQIQQHIGKRYLYKEVLKKAGKW